MKKTIVAIMALAGVAVADTVALDGNVTISDYTLSSSDSITFTDGSVILVDKDISVYQVDPLASDTIKNITWNFTSGSTLTVDHHFAITETADKASLESVNFGFFVTDSEFKSFVDSLTTTQSYQHTIIQDGSQGTWEMTSAWAQNVITLTLSQNLLDLGYTVKTGKLSGLDDLAPGEFGIGQGDYHTPVVIYGKALPVPEPTTATLSLLALAGLAVRRRRR